MRTCKIDHMTLSVDFAAGHITSLILNGVERVVAATPLFRVRLRDKAGQTYHYTAYEAGTRAETEKGGLYCDFPAPFEDLVVAVTLAEEDDGANWGISVAPNTGDAFAEWVDFPRVTLPDLKREDPEAGGEVLLPYNEGILVSNECVASRVKPLCSNLERIGAKNAVICCFPTMRVFWSQATPKETAPTSVSGIPSTPPSGATPCSPT